MHNENIRACLVEKEFKCAVVAFVGDIIMKRDTAVEAQLLLYRTHHSFKNGGMEISTSIYLCREKKQ